LFEYYPREETRDLARGSVRAASDRARAVKIMSINGIEIERLAERSRAIARFA